MKNSHFLQCNQVPWFQLKSYQLHGFKTFLLKKVPVAKIIRFESTFDDSSINRINGASLDLSTGIFSTK